MSAAPRTAKAVAEAPAGAARPLGRRLGGALYKRIAEQIERDIAAGTFPVGSLLPTEAEFSAQLDVGRHTVREALRVLSQGGLIVRRAGSGSTVISNGRRQVFAHAVSNFDQWFNYPPNVKRRHLDHEQVVADAELAQSLGCAVGSAWLRISALRTLDKTAVPLCWVDIYIQPRFARVMKSKRFDSTPVHEQIEAMFGVHIAEVEVSIWAGRVPARMAQILAAPADSPALVLRRRYLAANGELLQATCTVHAENRYIYAMNFRRAAHSHYGPA
ncbi:MAG: GntR family transcriptional regulator [Rubrivivax sp.]|nr:GntR family transcriptional regulator [Rubrivivax sp.]